MKIYHEKDADTRILKSKTIAVIGYGAQGRAQAQMLHDSKANVIVGVRKDGPSAKLAKKDGLKVASIADAAKKADIIHILIPDEIQKAVYEKEIKKFVTAGKTLSFSHGFNIVFKRIVPPKNVNVIMVAPKCPGTEERKCYLQGFGVPALFSVEQDATGDAKKIALAMAKAMYFTKAGVIEATFAEETYEDLFGEQTVLCGGTAELIKAGFETLVEAGYPPEFAYFECLHEMKLIVDLIYEGGIGRMYDVVSNTAEFGGRLVGPKIIDAGTKKRMKTALKDVESGKFAKVWMAEYAGGMKRMKKWRADEKRHQIEKVGAKIRKLFEKR
ncbi:MAG: ketol-acid reductoisomerase [Candidatus Peribacteraceae bacterium]|nr:ketol-acid reductoisomerase [Candidatus Peribacteraceae bacterium]